MSNLIDEVSKRLTFAIISHPDAGKTTMTEKLLLFGGAIHTAGEVKSRKTSKSTVSDFMQMEVERGISISTSVMAFDYGNRRINLLDTPGHEDNSDINNGFLAQYKGSFTPNKEYFANKEAINVTGGGEIVFMFDAGVVPEGSSIGKLELWQNENYDYYDVINLYRPQDYYIEPK